MTRAERLDFLMNLTNTSNAALARFISVDPSQISRLRGGTRSMPKKAEYIDRMAEYFVPRCLNEYARFALHRTIAEPSIYGADETELKAVLADWLRGAEAEPDAASQATDEFLRFFKKFAPVRKQAHQARGTEPVQADETRGVRLFFGDEGKRQAVRTFFLELTGGEDGGEIYLANDIGFSWVSSEQGFSDELGGMLRQAAERGYTFLRIQEAINDARQTYDSVNRWMQLYLMGAVREYVYPGLRDSVLHQTLLVVPDRLCLLSTGTGESERSGVTFLLSDKRAVSAYAREFRAFLAMCRPLNTVHTAANMERLGKCIADFEADDGNCIIKSGQLSVITMPESVADTLPFGEEGRALCADSRTRLERYLKTRTLTDIISLASPEEIAAGRVLNPLSFLAGTQPVYYTPEQYRTHLLRIVELLRRHENYRVILSEDTLPETHMMCAKECYRALMIKITEPFAVFELSDSNIVSASWEYLRRFAARYREQAENRDGAAERLLALAEKLKTGTQGETL